VVLPPVCWLPRSVRGEGAVATTTFDLTMSYNPTAVGNNVTMTATPITTLATTPFVVSCTIAAGAIPNNYAGLMSETNSPVTYSNIHCSYK